MARERMLSTDSSQASKHKARSSGTTDMAVQPHHAAVTSPKHPARRLPGSLTGLISRPESTTERTHLLPDLLPDNPRHLIPIKLNDRVLDDDLVLCTRTHPSPIIYPASAAPPPHVRTRPPPRQHPPVRRYHTIEHGGCEPAQPKSKFQESKRYSKCPSASSECRAERVGEKVTHASWQRCSQSRGRET